MMIPNSLFPPDMMLPSDFFMGSGYPDGDYVYGGDWFNKSGGTVTPKGRVTPCTKDGPYPPPSQPPAPPPPPPTANITNIVVTSATEPTATQFTLAVGSSMNFVATAVYSDGSTQNVTSFATWMTIDPNYISVAPGIVVGVDAGQMDPYQASFGVMYGGKTTWVPITVIPKVLQSIFIIPPAGPPANIIYVGEKQQFNLIADYGQGSNTIDVSDVATWSISPANVGTITAGVVTGTEMGHATITATFKGVSATSAIEVKGVPLKTISVTPASNTIYIYPTRGTVQYTATGHYLNDKKPAGIITADWTSTNISVATIDQKTGLATAGTMQGTTNIWAASISMPINGIPVYSDTPDAELCVECWQYVRYSENDYPNTPYDTYFNGNGVPYTIGTSAAGYGKGCMLSAYAMVFATRGLTINGELVNPVNLNQWLIDYKGYSAAGGYIDSYGKIAKFPGAPSSRLDTTNLADLDVALTNCRPAIVGVNSYFSGSNHFVLVIKKNDNDYDIIDPYSFRASKLSKYIVGNAYGNYITEVISF